MNKPFRTDSLIFRIASVYGGFCKDPIRLAETFNDMPKHVFDELNICRFRMCIMRGLLAIVAAIVAGSLLIGVLLAPLFALILYLTTGAWPEGDGYLMVFVLEMAFIGFIGLVTQIEYNWIGEGIYKIRTFLFGEQVRKKYTPSKFSIKAAEARKEIKALRQSLKEKYCYTAQFTDRDGRTL